MGSKSSYEQNKSNLIDYCCTSNQLKKTDCLNCYGNQKGKNYIDLEYNQKVIYNRFLICNNMSKYYENLPIRKVDSKSFAEEIAKIKSKCSNNQELIDIISEKFFKSDLVDYENYEIISNYLKFKLCSKYNLWFLIFLCDNTDKIKFKKGSIIFLNMENIKIDDIFDDDFLRAEVLEDILSNYVELVTLYSFEYFENKMNLTKYKEMKECLIKENQIEYIKKNCLSNNDIKINLEEWLISSLNNFDHCKLRNNLVKAYEGMKLKKIMKN